MGYVSKSIGMMGKIYTFLFDLLFKPLRKEMADAVKNAFKYTVVSWENIHLYTYNNEIYGYFTLGTWNYIIKHSKGDEKLSENFRLTDDKKYTVYAYYCN